MITVEKYAEDIKKIMAEYLERTVGPFEAKEKYYTRVLEELAKGYYSGLLSPDDVSFAAEYILGKVTAKDMPPKAFHDLPNGFMSLIDIEWELRHAPESAVRSLEELKEFLPKGFEY